MFVQAIFTPLLFKGARLLMHCVGSPKPTLPDAAGEALEVEVHVGSAAFDCRQNNDIDSDVITIAYACGQNNNTDINVHGCMYKGATRKTSAAPEDFFFPQRINRNKCAQRPHGIIN